MSEDAPLDPRARYFQLLQGQGEQPRLARESLQFEQERLKWLLARLKLRHHVGPIGRLHQERTDRYELRFSVFNEYFPTFPFLVGTSRLQKIPVPWPAKDGKQRMTEVDYQVHKDGYSAEPARFKQFRWVPFVVAYEAFYNQVMTDNETRKVALAFPRKGFKEGMVIHNDDSEQYWTAGLSWVYKAPKTGSKLYVQPFSALVEGIYAGGRGWRPEGEPG